MIDPQANPRAYLKLMALVAVVVGALLTALLALRTAHRAAAQAQPLPPEGTA